MLLGIFFLQFYLTGSLLVAAIIGFALAFFIVRVIVTQEFSSAVLPYVRRKNVHSKVPTFSVSSVGYLR